MSQSPAIDVTVAGPPTTVVEVITGNVGVGIAPGGLTGETLVKSSDSDFATTWSDISALYAPSSHTHTIAEVDGLLDANLALGLNNTATGLNGSFSVGVNNIASGANGSTAIGITNVASGSLGSIAIGGLNIASGNLGCASIGLGIINTTDAVQEIGKRDTFTLARESALRIHSSGQVSQTLDVSSTPLTASAAAVGSEANGELGVDMGALRLDTAAGKLRFDYNDSGSIVTHDLTNDTPPTLYAHGVEDHNATNGSQALTQNVRQKVLNNSLGAFTNTAHIIPGRGLIWDASTNDFDFLSAGLIVGDTVTMRMDFSVTTTGANNEITVELDLGVGAAPYTLSVGTKSYKSAGTYQLVVLAEVYMGDANTLNNSGEIYISSDSAGDSVVYNGHYVKYSLQIPSPT